LTAAAPPALDEVLARLAAARADRAAMDARVRMLERAARDAGATDRQVGDALGISRDGARLRRARAMGRRP
jgi:hypothetical protein